MNENRQRRAFPRFRQEQIEILPRLIAIEAAKLGAPAFEHVDAEKLGVARPAGENLRVLRNAGAIVIFGFVIDGGQRCLLQTGSQIYIDTRPKSGRA